MAARREGLGMGRIGAEDGVRALDSAMRTGEPNVAVLPVLPGAAAVPILADVAPTGQADADAGDAVVGPGDADVDEWGAQQVGEAVAHELGLPAGDVDAAAPLVAHDTHRRAHETGRNIVVHHTHVTIM